MCLTFLESLSSGTESNKTNEHKHNRSWEQNTIWQSDFNNLVRASVAFESSFCWDGIQFSAVQ